jgi:uncharacterized membrane protein
MKAARRKTVIVLTSVVAVAIYIFWILAAAAQEAGTAPSQAAEPAVGWINSALHWTVLAIEVIGIGAIVVGAGAAIAAFLYRTARDGSTEAEYHRFRAALGRSILLGLEFLVAADIINTVAIDPTLESVAVLAAVVAVRTFLSFALEVEIDGKWPWRKGDG